MIQDNINKLIPYISGNFITYPLWEEGKYIPFVNFWMKPNSNEEATLLDIKNEELTNYNGYKFVIDENMRKSYLVNYSIYPDFNELDDGGYEYVKKDWSIEEMISIIEEFIKK